jgi:hypothetical protein
MVWPQNLVSCTLLNTLHAEDDDQRTGISRYRFFIVRYDWHIFVDIFSGLFIPRLVLFLVGVLDRAECVPNLFSFIGGDGTSN